MTDRLFRSLALLLALLLAVGCTAAGREEDGGETFLLYFQNADPKEAAGGDALRTEEIRLEEGLSTIQQVRALTEGLLAGPTGDGLKRVIPAGTSLLSVRVEGLRALVDLSGSYSALSGVSLTMADYAVTLTLTQIPDITAVQITVRGQELAYRDKQVFTARDVLLSSEEDVVGTVEATLWFLDADGVLTGEPRTLDLYEGDTQTAAVARALEGGPADRSLSPSLPEGFQVKTVRLEEDICYVNLSSALIEGSGDGASLDTALRALGLSLCSLEAVGEVRIMIDGALAARYESSGLP